jgi:geranylgeranylglycerol-phosphate geranylgeranyltransferase
VAKDALGRGGVHLIRNVDYESSVNGGRYLRILAYYVKARSNVYIYAFATAITLLLGSQGSVDPLIFGSAVVASYFLALATYVYNDMTDLEVDKINKLSRPAVAGKATKRELLVLVSIMFGNALLLTLSINVYAALVAVIFSALGIAYSHPRSNLKEKFLLKTLVTAVGAGLSSLLGGVATEVSLPVIYATSMFFAFFFILGPLGDIGDLRGDRAVGRRTFPIVIGARGTAMIMIFIPILIIGATILTYEGMNMSLLGTFAIIATCSIVLGLLFQVSRMVDNVPWIRSIRPKMRFLHVMLQVSLLLAFLIH